jgi:hypothetical protein
MRRSSSPSGEARTKCCIRNESECGSSEMPCIEVVCGAVLSRLRVFGEEEWAQLKDHDRPPDAVYVEGIGWVAAVPCHVMN